MASNQGDNSSKPVTHEEAQQTHQTAKDQFLRLDQKVLQFQCSWDDSQSYCGDKIPLIMNYYLADDTIEIRETKESTEGRDPFTVFLKRRKLPRGDYAVGEGMVHKSMLLRNDQHV